MNDLVQRLRNLFKHGPTVEPSIDTINEAADRIVELEGDLDRSLKATLRMSVCYEEEIDKLEAALRKIRDISELGPGHMPSIEEARDIAIDALNGEQQEWIGIAT